MAASQELPQTHKALVLSSTQEPLSVKMLPIPQITPGSAIVRVLVANVIPYMRNIYNGTRQHPYPTPLVVGTSAIGRIVALGPDATSLRLGQLVQVDCTIRGRDDPTAVFLSGIHEGLTEGSRKLMHGEWRDSTYAEYAKVPLENCTVLDERRLCGAVEDGGLGYQIEDLAYISALLVPYGGLSDIGLKAGETVIISPATGSFGGAAVLVALAMGARVIAMGRNIDALNRIRRVSDRIETVPITGDLKTEISALQAFGPIDALLDISPPAASTSTHIKSAMLALKHSGRVSLMGGIRDDVPFPHAVIVHRNLSLKGKWMYEREDISRLVKMVEVGVLKLGKGAGVEVVGRFGLEDWDTAFRVAEESGVWGKQVLVMP